MAAIAVGGFMIDLELTVLDDREWWMCPVGGLRCGRVLVDLDTMGLDAMTCHVEIAHPHVLAAWWSRRQPVGSLSADVSSSSRETGLLR